MTDKELAAGLGSFLGRLANWWLQGFFIAAGAIVAYKWLMQ